MMKPLHIILIAFLAMIACEKDNNDTIVIDIDDNIYHTIKISTQVWMVENLKTTKYRNSDPITNITDNTEWTNLVSEACCDYDNDPNNTATYGKLYNWHAVNDSRNIAPDGWHVPSDNELITLSEYLGGDLIAGGKLKESGIEHWADPNEGATNERGFTALPAGYRSHSGSFSHLGSYSGIWSSSELNDLEAWFRELYGYKSNFTRSEDVKKYGFSVRCIKD